MYRIKDTYDEKIIEACQKYNTMSKACASLGLHFNTFKRRAIFLKVYKPNKEGKGILKKRSDGAGKIPLQEILDGKHPEYQTLKLKKRLIEEKILENKCNKCNIEKWNGEDIVLELNHKDGNKHNHKFYNLELLCPNCHSQTKTFRGKNINSRK